MILLALAAVVATPQPGALHTFKDWIVGCDNVRSCQANALMSDGADIGEDGALMLVINRDGAPNAPAMLDIPLPDKSAPGTRFELRIDGVAATHFTAQANDGAQIALSRTLLNAFANGRRAALYKADGAHVSDTSLSGLAAALLYIDDQQRRMGTIGALKATGPKPDSAVPPPPPAPLIMTPPPSAKPPRTITVAQAARLIGDDNARCDYGGPVRPEAHRLDATHSLVLIDHPCGNGAYNLFTSVYVLDEAGPPHIARFDTYPGMGEGNDPDLTNGGWDAKTRTLSSYEKGRGIGDCGVSQTYAWDGTRFRLIDQNVMGECRGSIDYITVWTARKAN